MAWREGFVHGRDFVFTYGPFAWLLFPDPDLVPRWAVLLYNALVYGAGLLFLSATALSPRLEWRVCAALWVLATVFCLHPVDRLQFTVVALTASFLTAKRSLALGLAAGGVAGFVLCVKANEGIVAGVVLAAATAHRAAREGFRWGWVAIIALPFAIGLAVFGPAGFAAYLRNAFELSSGYSEAMGFAGPMWQFALGAAGMLALAAIALAGKNAVAQMAAGAPCLLLAFGVWKHAMVRQDGHSAPLHAKLAVAALLLAMVSGALRARIAIGYSAVSLACAIPIMAEAMGPAVADLYKQSLFRGPFRTAVAWYRFPSHWEELRRVNQSDLARRKPHDRLLAAVRGHTTDAVPYSIDRIRASGLDWRPRPVIHSYTAYTPWLDSMNAAHISSSRGASRILLEYLPIDDRHVLLEDPRSLRSLVDNYDFLIAEDSVTVLSRRAAPRFGRETPLGKAAAAWNEVARVPEVPDRSRRIARIEVRPSPWGRLKSLAFRTVPVFIEERYASGLRKGSRIVPFNLSGGALFSGRPESAGELAELFGPARPAADSLVGFRLYTPGEAEFDPVIRIEWSFIEER